MVEGAEHVQRAEDDKEIIERVAAIDIGKAELVVCVRVPDPGRPGRRQQEVMHSSTLTSRLLALADRLHELGVTRVVMEATSDYWKPVFYLLETRGFDPCLLNARDVKHLPGRPKTDRLDAVWLAKAAERQMLRPSFVPPPPIRLLRDLTRYRASLIAVRTAEKNRVEKLLEDAQIKLSSVASDTLRGLRTGDACRPAGRGTPTRGARAAGPDPDAGQDPPAGGGVRRAVHRPSRVSAGHDAGPDRRDQRRHRRPRGPDRAADHSVRDCHDPPRWNHRPRRHRRLKGNRRDRAGHAPVPDPGIPVLLGPVRARGQRIGREEEGPRRYRARQPLPRPSPRRGRRRGAARATVAVGRSVLIIILHLLSDPDAHYHDLGSDYLRRRIDPQHQTRNHVRQLEALGYTVTLTPVA